MPLEPMIDGQSIDLHIGLAHRAAHLVMTRNGAAPSRIATPLHMPRDTRPLPRPHSRSARRASIACWRSRTPISHSRSRDRDHAFVIAHS
ncbi:hypothetical protein WS83_23015 [Burkholderia sp. MSMB2042]|nr:hypothetical protein WS78_20240 [Burkholderia savannae]KVG48731.1 hypothetical protein WS77_03105 [Burkholderia sp. MSMB0265]KVG90469.1 hypothetical protein WS82_17240 [Burkholderia sp. MSMB2041]KVH00125.1 hypothetical protein WS83_23015 [Burkholderia sp. MSMB2042]KWZ48091.1 hypothetical protein WS73_06095 [Burkholderia savannae]